jgi:hypothetical protein
MPVLLNRTRLRAGYDRLRTAEHRLPSQWRSYLLRAYTRTLAARHQQNMKRQQTAQRWRLFLLVAGLGMTGFCGRILWEQDFADDLMVGGLWGLGVILLCLIGFVTQQKPKEPPVPHPLHPPLREHLFPPRLPGWFAELHPPAPAPTEEEQKADFGIKGEIGFVQTLERTFGTEALVFHRLQQSYGDDLDVILICSRGLWYFEVKYWSGEVKWQAGRWARRQEYFEAGGHTAIKRPPVTQPPNEQWTRMSQELKITLEKRGGRMLRRCPQFLPIQGGLVFNYPTVTLQIAQNAPFQWGNEATWLSRLVAAPPYPNLTPRNMLILADILLDRHQQLNRALPLMPMDRYAENLIQATENNLSRWVQAHS